MIHPESQKREGVLSAGIVTGNDTGRWSYQIRDCLAGTLSLGCIMFTY